MDKVRLVEEKRTYPKYFTIKWYSYDDEVYYSLTSLACYTESDERVLRDLTARLEIAELYLMDKK